MVVYSGRTVEQAIEKGLKDLNLPRMKAHIKVISREKKRFSRVRKEAGSS